MLQNANNNNYNKFYDVINNTQKKKKHEMPPRTSKNVENSDTNDLLKQYMELQQTSNSFETKD